MRTVMIAAPCHNGLIDVWYVSSLAETCRNVFEVKVVDGELMSEDIVFCEKIRNLGEKVYIDPNVKCGHIGVKKWVGDFAGMIKKEE